MSSVRLLAVAGPVKGTVIPLDGEHLVMGRSAACDFVLDDPAVSRRHCAIRSENGKWAVTDIETRNGTFVNGARVHEQGLKHCDQIRVGASLFLFLTEPEGYGSLLPDLPPEPADITHTVVIRTDDSLVLRGAVAAQELQTLLSLSGEIHAIRKLDDLQRRLLEAIFEVTPARHAGILWFDAESADPYESFGWEREKGRAPAPEVSRADLERVQRERVALVSESPRQSGATVILPLRSAEAVFGAIAVQSGEAFRERHTQLLVAVAAISSTALDTAHRLQWLESENSRLRAEIGLQHNMVGESPAMRAIFRQIDKIGPSEATILILGESGTGKELVARAIHASSPRAARPFVAINCATLSETLLESELFGHEKGAFTGAVAQKRGKLELAEGGTLFLDEIGEVAPLLQAKLLRVLQEREFERVGGVKTLRANIRVIAATNRDLEEQVRTHQFRQDLYFRLNVIAIRMPALRDRREDIPLLADYFLQQFAAKSGRPISGFAPAARACMATYYWPGNVRELENTVERAVVLGSSEFVLPEDLPESLLETWQPPDTEEGGYHEQVRLSKRQIIIRALEECGGNQVQAARSLGLNPTYLSRLIRNLDLR